MPKRGRPKLPEELVRSSAVSFRLPKALIDRLRARAAVNDRSVAREVEHLIERGFRDDDVMAAVLDRVMLKLTSGNATD